MNCSDNKIKHLEFIENTISRLSNNCSFTKKLCITLLAGCLTIGLANDAKIILFCLPIFVIAMWLLDARYLQLERKFRFLYNEVRAKDEEKIDFSMDVDRTMSKKEKKAAKVFFGQAMFSPTLVCFYTSLIVALLLVFMYYFNFLNIKMIFAGC